MNINVKTVFFFSQAVAKQFIKQKAGGKIINVASFLSFQGGIRASSYTASKSGVMGITRLMATNGRNTISMSMRLHRDTWQQIIQRRSGQTRRGVRPFWKGYQQEDGGCRMI